MRIELRGLFSLCQIYQPAGNIIKVEASYAVITDYEKQAWNALKKVGLDTESVVEITPSEVSSSHGEKAPYAVVIYNDETTVEQVDAVIEYLRNVGLDVEVPSPIRFCKKKN